MRPDVAKEACAGHRIIDFVANSVAGEKTEFHPYLPGNVAGKSEQKDDCWYGEFVVSGKRLFVQVTVIGKEEDGK